MSNGEGQKVHDPSDFWDKLFDASIQFALAAIRGVILINGAAALALLAFVAQYAGVDNPNKAVIAGLAYAMIVFGIGAFWGVMVAAASYVAQWAFAYYVLDDDKAMKYGAPFQVVGIICAVVGMGFFLWGLWEASATFESIPISEKPSSGTMLEQEPGV